MTTFRLAAVILFSVLKFALADPVGEWTFDNGDSLLAATAGNDLQLVGLHSAIAGPQEGDGAARIGVGSYYRCYHDIEANGDGNPDWVNRFTIVMDVRIPQVGDWYCLYQTNYQNSNDGDWFVHPDGSVGVGDTGYSFDILTPGEWYRLAISVNLGEHYDYYLDGQLLHPGGAQDFEGRFALYPADDGNQVLFFADNDGEDGIIDVARIQLYDTDLSAAELADLGGYGHVITGPPSYDMLPYLQTPTPTSVHIGWHSAAGFGSTVEYGLDENLGHQALGTYTVLDLTTVWHDVVLTGLSPATRYYYQCETAGERSDLRQFTTPSSEADHVRFVVYGDNRTNAPRHAEVIRSIRDKAAELYGSEPDEALDVIINVGDIVTSGWVLSQYQTEYFFPASPLSGVVPFMVSIGNHEAESPYYYEYMRYDDMAGPEGELYYSFRLASVLFVALNSNTGGDTQLAWLEETLDAAETDIGIDWVFVYTHHPGRSEIWPDGNTDLIQSQVIPLLQQYGKAAGLFYGHSHNYERGAPDEGRLRLLLSGGGGSALDRWGMYGNQQDYPEIHRSHDYYCYVIFDVDCQDRSYMASSFGLGHEDRPMANALFDSFSRHLDDAPPPQPQALGPSGQGGTGPCLTASAYEGEHPVMSSHFQLTTEGDEDWSAAIIDSVRHWENIYGDTGAPDWEPIDLNADLDLGILQLAEGCLLEGDTYVWRLRYRDQNLLWSDWSAPTSFQAGATDVPPTSPSLGLGRAVPNPFNPRTEIHFTVGAPMNLALDIYDTQGRHLRSLADGPVEAGDHARLWDGRDQDGRRLPSGLYLIHLSGGGLAESGKLVLLK